MESHLKNRPKKTVFNKEKIKKIQLKAITKIRRRFLPDKNIIKIILIGSSVKDTFGKYDHPGFRGSLFSDFDFIIFVENSFKIPKWLIKEHSGKPFPDDDLNLAYRNKKFIENKYDVEIFFIRKKDFQNKKTQKLGEIAGIPMTKKSKHKFIEIYSR